MASQASTLYDALPGVLNSDFVVHVDCPCGATTEFEKGPNFRNSDGDLLLNDPVLIRCPVCTDPYWADVEFHERKNHVTFTLTDRTAYDDVFAEGALLGACPCGTVSRIGEHDADGGEFYCATIIRDAVAIPCVGCDRLRRVDDGFQNSEGVLFSVFGPTVSLDCPTCDDELWKLDFECGPDAPEVGWEYYECPDCGERVRPDAVEQVSHDD